MPSPPVNIPELYFLLLFHNTLFLQILEIPAGANLEAVRSALACRNVAFVLNAVTSVEESISVPL